MPVSHRVELKADMANGDTGAYTQGESDKKFQLPANYLPVGCSYSKAEFDTRFQPKGNYAPAGDNATKTELGLKLNETVVTKETGASAINTISQKGIMEVLKNVVITGYLQRLFGVCSKGLYYADG